MISNDDRSRIASDLYYSSFDIDGISQSNRYHRNADVYLQIDRSVGSRIHLFVNKHGKIECLYTKDGYRISEKLANNYKEAIEFLDECPDLKIKFTSKRKRKTDEDENESEDSDVIVETVKRPRGRPKKIVTPEEIEAEKNREKRPVGRPRKHPKPEESPDLSELKEFLAKKRASKLDKKFSFFKYLFFCTKTL